MIFQTLKQQPLRETLGEVHHHISKLTAESSSEIWFREHEEAVFTVGKDRDSSIPNTIEVDRLGSVTYQGSGVLSVYTILNITNRLGIDNIYAITQREVIRWAYMLMDKYNVSYAMPKQLNGVYVDLNGQRHKISSIGLDYVPVNNAVITNHGFSINVNPDESQLMLINPCNMVDTRHISLKQLGINVSMEEVCSDLTDIITNNNYFKHAR